MTPSLEKCREQLAKIAVDLEALPPNPSMFLVIHWDGETGLIDTFISGHSITRKRLSCIIEKTVEMIWPVGLNSQRVEKRLKAA